MDGGLGGMVKPMKHSILKKILSGLIALILAMGIFVYAFTGNTHASYVVPIYAGLKTFTTGDNSSTVGNSVIFGQTILDYFGYYYGDMDGICGPYTYNALVDYQISKGLYVDGICGQNTWRSLLLTGESSTSFSCRSIARDYNLCYPTYLCPESSVRCFKFQVDNSTFEIVYY